MTRIIALEEVTRQDVMLGPRSRMDLLVYIAMRDEIRGRMGSRSGRNWIMNYPATAGNDSL